MNFALQEQLEQENKELKETVVRLQSSNNILQNSILELKEQIEWLRRQFFGQRSEKFIADLSSSQLLFEGFDSNKVPQKKQPVVGHERTKSDNKGSSSASLPDNLPVERILLDLPEEEKICQETGEALVKIGEEISRKLASKPGSYYIKEIIRPKYANPKKSEEGIKIADLPCLILSRCQADNSFLADVLVKKYADHLPIYRQSEILSREGIKIPRQLLTQWAIKGAMALKPLYDEMQTQILNSGNVFIDESPVRMLDAEGDKAKLSYMWILCGGNEKNPSYRTYIFRPDRKHSNAQEILKEFTGVVHSDKYGAYERIAETKQFTWCPCWAHIRRKFFEAEHGDPEFRKMALDKIQQLFLIEETAWTYSPEERLLLRQKEAVPIIDDLTKAVKEALLNGKVLPKSNFKEALGYYYSLVPYLKNYTLHPWARLDNNISERIVRPLAIGRKNWLFFGSEDGGEAAAISLSLVQTCRALKINPREYLESVMDQLMDYNSQKLVDLLPNNWAKNKTR